MSSNIHLFFFRFVKIYFIALGCFTLFVFTYLLILPNQFSVDSNWNATKIPSFYENTGQQNQHLHMREQTDNQGHHLFGFRRRTLLSRYTTDWSSLDSLSYVVSNLNLNYVNVSTFIVRFKNSSTLRNIQILQTGYNLCIL